MTRTIDPVKAAIGAAVQEGLLAPVFADTLATAVAEVQSVEASPITPFQTMIRVRLASGMPRYFLVRVAEQL